MKRAAFVRSARQRDVDVRKRVRFFLRAKFLRAVFDRRSHGVADFVEQLSNDRLFVFAERFHLLAPRGNASAAAEIFYPGGFERLRVARISNLAQGGVA